MAKYYIAVGNKTHAQFLRNCQSDEIEQAECEAIEELATQRAQGDEDVIVRVVEGSTRLVERAIHKGNVNNLK